MAERLELIDSFSGQFAFLGNFHACRVNYEGVMFPTTEHAFQWSKTLDPKEKEAVLWVKPGAATTPGQAKRRGGPKARGGMITLRPDWEDARVQVMTDIVRAKFAQCHALRDKLLATVTAMFFGEFVTVPGANTRERTCWGGS